MKIFEIKLPISKLDFEETMGRPPKNNTEMEEFVRLCRKGIEAQLDWQIIFNSAKDFMR